MTSVVGLDLAITASGVARCRDIEAGGVWRAAVVSAGPTRRTLAEQAVRLRDVTERVVAAAIRDGVPDLVVVEMLPHSTAQRGIRDVAYVWWSVVATLTSMGVPIGQVSPSTLKVYATGRGKGVGKPEMVAAVTAHVPGALTGGSHDAADAVHLAAMGARWLGHPVDLVPDSHLRAMDSSKWPPLNRLGGNDSQKETA